LIHYVKLKLCKDLLLPGLDHVEDAPENTRTAISGDNVYVVSWDKKNGNWEVFLARSTDNGETFEDTVNLSNTSETRSDMAEIHSDEENVYMTWWETSKDGIRDPVIAVSYDNGATFGPVLGLSANGTIGEAAEGEEETEEGE
jgi:hypothetical protein